MIVLQWTASALQSHPWSLIVCDEDATLELRVKTGAFAAPGDRCSLPDDQFNPVRYFKSIEKVQDEVEKKYGGAAVRKSRINGVH